MSTDKTAEEMEELLRKLMLEEITVLIEAHREDLVKKVHVKLLDIEVGILDEPAQLS